MKQASWLKGVHVAVIGLGVTGKACVRALAPLGAEVLVTDTRGDLSRFEEAIEAVRDNGARFVTPQELLKQDAEILVVSPGLSPEHDLVKGLKDKGTQVLSEIEVAYRLAEGTFIGVTGTNGKTTVTGLTGHVLSAKYEDVRVVGNIGDPLIESVTDSTEDTVFVTELSSYQLELCETLRPRVASVLNVQPDHLERHKTMEAYAAAKQRLIENQEAGDTAVLNADDPWVRAMAGHGRAQMLYVSTAGPVERGGFVKGNKLIARLDGGDCELLDADEMALRGEHNHANALHAAMCSLQLGMTPEQVAERLRSFRGYPHRIECIAVKDHVEYVDDSKATNPDAVLAALRAFAGRPLVLILGGDDKGLDYTEFYGAVRAAADHVVVLGTGLRRMAVELRDGGFVNVHAADDMPGAVKAASGLAAPGGVVLLSPASSSFDLFKNYEERGRAFQDAVAKL